jgi:hypothetical protein
MPQRGREVTEEQTRHLAECGACAAQWEPHRSLAAGLQSLVEEWRREEAPARVETGLSAAFRAQAAFQGRRPARQSWWTPVLVWASAAAAMIAMAAFLVRGYQPVSRKPDTVAAPHRMAQTGMEIATAQGTADDDADDDSSILGEGFIRLPNAARIQPNEDFNVVRVEVPGSDMIALGLSVSEDRASETVVADLALGSDGMARAVRFVN